MEARLKDNYPYKTIQALEGREYIKGEWRPVPDERLAEAQQHPDLELRETPPPVIEAAATHNPEGVSVPQIGEFAPTPFALADEEREAESQSNPKIEATARGRNKNK